MAAAAWLLTLTLRKNPARVRYWVWMAASVKFLVPFSLLIAAGARLAPVFAAPIATRPSLAALAQQIELPFPQEEYFAGAGHAASVARHAAWIPLLLAMTWLCGMVLVMARILRGWLRVRAALRNASPMKLALDFPVFSTNAVMEPGIFGVFLPVLLLPQGVVDRLSRAQLDAIVAHEMCHVRRRDNLTFALHMLVEAVFWFFPGVWWIGARLIDEREQACDEAVVQAGSAAETYAEGILTVCKYCVESPLACVSGITGSDLKERIIRIMSNRMARKLHVGHKSLLCATGILALGIPLLLGITRAPEVLAEVAQDLSAAKLPKFEVVSIKPYTAGAMMTGIRFTPDGVNITGMPLYMMVREAFGLSNDRILNEPSWVKSDRYDLAAKVDAADVSELEKLEPEQRWAMMLPVLEDRCGLKYHHETKTLEVYALVAAKGGPKLKLSETPTDMPPMKTAGPSTAAPPIPRSSDGVSDKKMGQFFMRASTEGMSMNAHGVPIAGLIRLLSMQLGSTIVDKTGLAGKYDFTLSWAPDPAAGGMMQGPGGGPAQEKPASADTTGPSLVTALQEQLGLKLVARKEPVDVVVIDHIQQPSPN
ncbi:MAG TPA: M56 family metallopeptidase [Terracidiphilus sp.]|nr:M56 family metallopeptidase [Terracidiphilus sp.]